MEHFPNLMGFNSFIVNVCQNKAFRIRTIVHLIRVKSVPVLMTGKTEVVPIVFVRNQVTTKQKNERRISGI